MYNRQLLFWAGCAGMLFFGISLITLGSIAAGLKQKFNLDEISSGTLFSILPVGILIGSLFFGPLSDKFGYKLILAVSCFIIFAGFEGIAHAPSSNILKLYILLFGAGGGAINGATNALIADISVQHKGADLSLLGVFFAIGALGMPFILGFLGNELSFETIISSIGFGALALGIFYLIIKFPALPKKVASSISATFFTKLLADKFLLLIGFFLFCQSSFEAIINNWTTTYLSNQFNTPLNKALYALSLFVAGMAVMRLLLGSVLRNLKPAVIWTILFTMVLTGLLFLSSGKNFAFSAGGLLLLGAGLAGGFPLMLGYTGNRYTHLSATAFSVVLTIALMGNMIVNYFMGIIAQHFGIKHLISVAVIELLLMIVLCLFILRKMKQYKN